MSHTSIRGSVLVWADDGAPRPQLPVRCLEDELLPDVAPLAPHVAPTLRGARTAEKIKATVKAKAAAVEEAVASGAPAPPPPKPRGGRRAGGPCRGCAVRREVAGTGFCSRPACDAMRQRLERLAAEGPPPRVTGMRQRR